MSGKGSIGGELVEEEKRREERKGEKNRMRDE